MNRTSHPRPCAPMCTRLFIPHMVRVVGAWALVLSATVVVAADLVSDRDTLSGTWTSGAGHVVTGLSFFNLVNNTFNVPKTAGQSYSFYPSKEDKHKGFWEEAIFHYNTTGALLLRGGPLTQSRRIPTATKRSCSGSTATIRSIPRRTRSPLIRSIRTGGSRFRSRAAASRIGSSGTVRARR